MKKYLAAALVVWVLLLIWDNFLHALLIPPFAASAMAAIPGAKEHFSKLYESLGDLCMALVFVALYARTRSVFGENAAGGATYGVYAGLLGNFPTWFFMTLYFAWPKPAVYWFTIALVCVWIVSGALAGVVYKAMASPKAA
jgi:hypothetical protein